MVKVESVARYCQPVHETGNIIFCDKPFPNGDHAEPLLKVSIDPLCKIFPGLLYIDSFFLSVFPLPGRIDFFNICIQVQ